MFSYSGDPKSSQRNMLRFWLDDTDPQDYKFEDAEIDALLLDFGVNPEDPGSKPLIQPSLTAGSRLAARRMAETPTIRVGSYQQDNTAAAQLRQRQVEIEQKRIAASGGLFAGGVSVRDKKNARNDPDRPADSFFTGQFDFPVSPATATPSSKNEKPGQGGSQG